MGDVTDNFVFGDGTWGFHVFGMKMVGKAPVLCFGAPDLFFSWVFSEKDDSALPE